MFLKNIAPVVVPKKLCAKVLHDGKHYCALGVLCKQLLEFKDYELFEEADLYNYYLLLNKLNEDFYEYNDIDGDLKPFNIDQVYSIINQITNDNDNADRYSRRRKRFIKNLKTYKIPFILEEDCKTT